jgi:Ca-activated chloride channel family protein
LWSRLERERAAARYTSEYAEEDGTDLPPASRFKLVPVNPWVMTQRDPLSTFALDVDTASYTLCRRYIRGGFLPPTGAVRMEEFINYFNYQYPQRTNPTFAVHADAAQSPFARAGEKLTLLKIGVKARTIGRDQRRAAHLIFVVDSSASMDQTDRLPLVQHALHLLVDKLSPVDRVSLITCAGQARLHLEAISAREQDTIRQAVDAIQPAGPTNLLAGLKLGYATARRAFAPKQINHVVLCSDGVANVGQTEAELILSEVAADRKQGITITCVGVGYGSYNDAFLEALANRGDGSYVFLDSIGQAQRVFVEQLAATLQTVAKDARIQVEFNPDRVRRYRLIGYENRDIEDKRFRDDTIDAGEVGSGQCSTALYELELIGQRSADRRDDLGTVFVRYRHAETGQIEEVSSRLMSSIVRRRTVESDPRFFLAAGAARFAELLRQSEHAQHGSFTDVCRIVEQVSLALPLDRDVRELAELIGKAPDLPRSP